MLVRVVIQQALLDDLHEAKAFCIEVDEGSIEETRLEKGPSRVHDQSRECTRSRGRFATRFQLRVSVHSQFLELAFVVLSSIVFISS